MSTSGTSNLEWFDVKQALVFEWFGDLTWRWKKNKKRLVDMSCWPAHQNE
jgi:hypothetical protein